jgi:uncharacterized repeat protein (TIGR03803 family)
MFFNRGSVSNFDSAVSARPIRHVALACCLMLASHAHAATLTTLVTFDGGSGAGTNGRGPGQGLIIGATGNLFGVSASGGAGGRGTIFKVDSSGILTSLYNFSGPEWSPNARLYADPSGNFFGTTSRGGAFNVGTIFKLDSNGSFSTLAEFGGNGSNDRGRFPTGALIPDGAGNLLVNTVLGGTADRGAIVRLNGDNTLTTLASTDPIGRRPRGGLIADANGNVFGTTIDGGPTLGSLFSGTIFKLDTNNVLTSLANFTGPNGATPTGTLIADAAGNFYGTTALGGAGFNLGIGLNPGFGTVFKYGIDGVLTTLASFDGTNGARPFGALLADAAGNLFGTTVEGGAFDSGTVFKLDTAGTITTLVRFAASPNGGGGVFSDLVVDAFGNLYGSNGEGGAFNSGTIFKVSNTGFVMAANVPEPASWAMLIIGFGMVGGMARGRRRIKATV